jgi:branched-chain amino acid transport system permease protein
MMETAPPRESVPPPARLSSNRLLLGAGLIVLLSVGLIPALTGRNINYELTLAITILYFATLASSWNILGGYTEYISLGHNAFAAIGGYFSGILLLYYGLPVFLTAAFGGLLAMFGGFIFGFVTLRIRRGPAFIISTIALVLIMELLLDNWSYINGANGINLPFIPMPVELAKLPYYYAFLALLIVTVLVSRHIRRSKFGLSLRAISQDEVKAESAGIPTNRYKIVAFAISGYFAGVAGALYAQHITYITPGIYLEVIFGTRIVLMSILGGKGTVSGPVIGAVALVLLDEVVRAQFGESEFNLAIMGIILLVVILFFPEGIVGTLRRRGRLPAFLNWD